MKLNALDVIRNIILASVLEPIPEKKGCTTRTKNWQDKSKLEYFLISGVNIGIPFYNLIKRIVDNNYKQPELIYDIAYEAQLESFKNRNGGKINFGIIELLIPIIATQIIYQNNDISVLEQVENVLKNTTKKDVEYHLKFRKIAREVSKQLPNIEFYDVENMYDYYKLPKNVLEDIIHKEYINHFKIIREIYDYLNDNYKPGNLLNNTLDAYNNILKKCDNFYGLAADYICVAIYLYLSINPEAVII